MSLYNEDLVALDEQQLIADNLERLRRRVAQGGRTDVTATDVEPEPIDYNDLLRQSNRRYQSYEQGRVRQSRLNTSKGGYRRKARKVTRCPKCLSTVCTNR